MYLYPETDSTAENNQQKVNTFINTVLLKGAFQKSELAGWTRHVGSEKGFFQEALLKNHLLCA